MSEYNETSLNMIMKYDENTGATTMIGIITDLETKQEKRREVFVFKNKTVAEVEAMMMEIMKPYLEAGSFHSYRREELKH